MLGEAKDMRERHQMLESPNPHASYVLHSISSPSHGIDRSTNLNVAGARNPIHTVTTC